MVEQICLWKQKIYTDNENYCAINKWNILKWNTIERPIQMVCDMEIGAVETNDAISGVDGNNNDNKQKEKCKDDNDTIERPTRKAKLIAKRKIKTIYDDNDE